VCSPLSVCGTDQYQSVAPTATTDKTCAFLTQPRDDEYVKIGRTAISNQVVEKKTTSCRHNYYIRDQYDAGWGKTNIGDGCVPCPHNTTTHGPNKTTTNHSLSSCHAYEDSYYTGPRFYIPMNEVALYSDTGDSRHPLDFKKLRTTCKDTEPILSVGSWNQNTLCQTSGTGGVNNDRHACLPHFYRNNNNNLNTCQRCTVCKFGYKKACGLKDAICLDSSIRRYNFNVVSSFLGTFYGASIYFYFVVPTVVPSIIRLRGHAMKLL
jgi:hypothetical protein